MLQIYVKYIIIYLTLYRFWNFSIVQGSKKQIIKNSVLETGSTFLITYRRNAYTELPDRWSYF